MEKENKKISNGVKQDLPKAYTPKAYEDEIYKKWEESGYFNPDVCVRKGVCAKDAASFSIVLPPPNITDKLHLGQGSTLAIEDLLIRYHRMKGDKTLWLPGTDHAAIATQNVVERKILEEEGLTRHDLGKEEFLKRVWDFVRITQTTILKQTRKMGASLDWSRQAFTLDEPRKKAVRKMFVNMYKEGIIYRGERIVNWCPRCHSTLADDEVSYKEQKAKLYTFRYSKDFPFAIATTRPETKLGDTAVAINPKDKCYQKYLKKNFAINFVGVPLKLKIIADRNVDRKFGTGALGVTPAHSMVDWQMAEANKLPTVKVINEDGKIGSGFGKYSGKDVLAAREMIVEELKRQKLLEKEEEMDNNLSVCYRCGTPIEPLPSKQWFIAVDKKLKRLGNKSLKEKAIEVAKTGKIEFIPERFTKKYLDWMENLHDWCISRQIWFGHEIPVWYCQKPKTITAKAGQGNQKPKIDKNCSKPIVSPEKIEKCPYCGGKVEQDPDTLDTWFSSGMWTFSTLGWPGDEVEIIASRHADTKVHKPGVFVGQEKETDFGLNEEGKRQAEELAEKLKEEKIDIIFSAPLKRAIQTAEVINKYHNLKIIQDERLNEYRFGFMNGKSFAELEKEYPNLPAWKGKGIDHRFKDEEKPIEVKKRVDSFLQDLKKNYPNKKVFIATHCGVLDFFDMILNKKNFEEIKNLKHQKAGIERYKIKTDEDLKIYHPTQVLETGYEILTLWVSRMIMMSLFALEEIPFEKVYLHGMVLDEQGKKMSKSRGNGIDPIDVINKYGTDAVRLSLLIGNTPGNDMKFTEEKIAGYRNFTNKLWNISRFIMQNVKISAQGGFASGGKNKNDNLKCKIDYKNCTLADNWILEELEDTIFLVDNKIKSFEFSAAGEKLRDFTWNEFADWYIEISKIEKSKDEILLYILKTLLKLWHPFMPFVTEIIWQEMGNSKLLMVEPWPNTSVILEGAKRPIESRKLVDKQQDPIASLQDDINIKDFDLIKDIITSIRNARAENKVEPAKKIKAVIYAGDKKELIESQAELIKGLRTGISELEVKERGEKIKGEIYITVNGIEIYLIGAIDKKKERERINKEIADLEKLIAAKEKKLSNKEFTSKAPKEIVEKEREVLKSRQADLEKLKKQLSR